jgi:hypothetical protein
MGKSRHQSHPSSRSYDDGEFNQKKHKKYGSKRSNFSVEEVLNTKTRQQSKKILKDLVIEDDDELYWEEF